MRAKVAIIGAGIGGLSAAYRLKQQGFEVIVYDQVDYLGGRMKTIEHNGFTIDVGAGILPTTYTDAKDLIRDLGMEDMIETISGYCAVPRGGKNYLLNLNNLQLSLMLSGLISLAGKLSLIKPGLMMWKNRNNLTFHNMGLAAHLDEETVTEYCQREMSPEVLDYLLGPMVRTMYLQPPEEASIAELLWCMKNLSGAIFSLRGGMDSLPRKLAEQLDVQLNTEVKDLQVSESGVSLMLEHGADSSTVTADYCVICTDAEGVRRLYSDGLTQRQQNYLQSLNYCPDITVHFCLDSEPAIEAALVQVPEAVDADLAALVVDHKKGSGRVPPGKGMITAHFLDRWGRTMINENDETVLSAAIDSVSKLVPEVKTNLEGWHIERWPRAATLGEVGTYKRLAGFMQDIDPDSRVQLSGDYMSLSSVNVSIATSKVAVRNIINQQQQ